MVTVVCHRYVGAQLCIELRFIAIAFLREKLDFEELPGSKRENVKAEQQIKLFSSVYLQRCEHLGYADYFCFDDALVVMFELEAKKL